MSLFFFVNKWPAPVLRWGMSVEEIAIGKKETIRDTTVAHPSHPPGLSSGPFPLVQLQADTKEICTVQGKLHRA